MTSVTVSTPPIGSRERSSFQLTYGDRGRPASSISPKPCISLQSTIPAGGASSSRA